MTKDDFSNLLEKASDRARDFAEEFVTNYRVRISTSSTSTSHTMRRYFEKTKNASLKKVCRTSPLSGRWSLKRSFQSYGKLERHLCGETQWASKMTSIEEKRENTGLSGEGRG